MNNPFGEKTLSYRDFKTMSDLLWHCSKCELESGQAKTWQIWRQSGIQLDTEVSSGYYSKRKCKECQKKTVHRKLKTLELSEDTTKRAGISSNLANKIKNVYENEEAFYLRKMPSRELEIDHKFPQVRWGKDEQDNNNDMTIEEIKSRFILLTRKHNLLKSRQCEKCKQEGVRGSFPGINFFYKGNQKWDGINDFDEQGCEGCFWYSPYLWREYLQKIIDKSS